jgi:outer membrane protein assembly factor BamB
MRGLHRAGVLAAVLLLTGCTLFKGDKKEEDPPAKLADFEPTLKIDVAWSASIGDGSEHLRLGLGPDSDGSRVFAASHDGVIAAFDATKGRRLWRRKTKLPLSAGPGTDGTLVVAGSANGDVVALRADDGQEAWRVPVASEVLAAPTLARGLVLVRTVDGKLAALRASDGTQAWFVQEPVPRLSVRGTAAPVVVGNVVICGFDSGRVVAYDITDGSELWQAVIEPPTGRNEVERLNDVNATVRAVGEDLYAVGFQGRLAALALESGQILWSQEMSSHSGLAADLNAVFVAAADGTLSAFRRADATELWQDDSLRNRDLSGPAAIQSSVVVGDFDGYVHWFDAATGVPQARARARGGRVVGTPLVVNDLVYLQTEGGKLTAFRAQPRARR